MPNKNEIIQELIRMLHDSDDKILDLKNQELTKEEKELINKIDNHLDEAYKLLNENFILPHLSEEQRTFIHSALLAKRKETNHA